MKTLGTILGRGVVLVVACVGVIAIGSPRGLFLVVALVGLSLCIHRSASQHLDGDDPVNCRA